jgi:4-phytase/acid phosphatase
VNLRGALGIKATLIQNWLLESAQWPDRYPGWGEITPDILSQLLVARAAIFNSLNRAAPYARDRGSAILSAMADSLLGRHFDPHANNAKCVVYMGHDTNIAHVAELLGLEWDLENFAYNDIPPASFVQFILWEKQTGEEVITAEFVAQPLEVMHSVCPENIRAGVIVKQLEFNPAPSERLDSRAFEYSKEKFAKVVSEVINQDCIPHARALKKGTMK